MQPVSLAYSGHRNLPMTRRLSPFYAWYGDMDLAPHLWEALQMGPVEVTVVCHPPLSLSGEMNRKALARHAEREARDIVVTVNGSTVTLTGRVDSWAERIVARGAAWSAPGVTNVINELAVGRGDRLRATASAPAQPPCRGA